MDYFYGIVEDRQDPLKVGRVRVRIHGIHTDDKLLIASSDLPWCQVILPTTSAGLSGLGTGHGLVEGSTVFGYFRDQAKQVYMGSKTRRCPYEYRVEACGDIGCCCKETAHR